MSIPRLSEEQVTRLIQQVAEYIERQGQTFRQRGMPLSESDGGDAAVFSRIYPGRARVVVLTSERLGNPPFYGDFTKIGFGVGSLPDLL